MVSRNTRKKEGKQIAVLVDEVNSKMSGRQYEKRKMQTNNNSDTTKRLISKTYFHLETFAPVAAFSSLPTTPLQ